MRVLILILILFFPKNLYAGITSIGNNELNYLIKYGINVIDVRTPEEWRKKGIIKNSLLISLVNKKGKFNFQEWHQKFNQKRDPNKPVVFVCASGVRSHYISRIINKISPELKIYNLTNGINYWIKSGNLILNYKD